MRTHPTPMMFASVSVLLALALVSGCGERCVNKEFSSATSPSGKKKAVVFARQCGGTVPNVQVSVLRASANLPNVPGNVFIAQGEQAPQVHWLSDETLRISGFGAAKVSKQTTEALDTKIYYEAQPVPSTP